MFKLKRKCTFMIMSCVLIMTMLFSTTIPAFAATASVGSVAGDVDGSTIVGQDVDQGKQSEYSDDIVVDDSAIENNCDVYATVADTDIVVTVPKTIVLDGKVGSTNTGTYSVKVQGDVSADTIITVEPQDELTDREGVNFEMSSVGKDNIPADVEQVKTTFTYSDGVRADVAVSTTGTVTAYGMTAGQWHGDFSFNISLNENNLVYNGSLDTYDTSGYYVTPTGLSDYLSIYTHSSEISVIPGETLYIGLESERYSSTFAFEKSFQYQHPWKHEYAFVFYDADGNGISGITASELEDARDDIDPKYNNSEKVQVRKLVVPNNAVTMIANMHNHNSTRRIEALRIYRNSYGQPLTAYTSVLPKDNNLYGKQFIAFGDSITQGTGTRSWTSWADYIATVNNMPLTMNAIGGTKASQMLEKMSASSTDISALTEDDFVIVTGFVNDAKQSTELGALTKDGTTEFDTTTYIGSLEKMLYDYTTNLDYKAKLGIILTPRPTGAESFRDKPEYWEGAISVCEKYNVPYLNLYSLDVEYVDGVHPTLAGQRDMAEQIEAWMNML